MSRSPSTTTLTSISLSTATASAVWPARARQFACHDFALDLHRRHRPLDRRQWGHVGRTREQRDDAEHAHLLQRRAHRIQERRLGRSSHLAGGVPCCRPVAAHTCAQKREVRRGEPPTGVLATVGLDAELIERVGRSGQITVGGAEASDDRQRPSVPGLVRMLFRKAEELVGPVPVLQVPRRIPDHDREGMQCAGDQALVVDRPSDRESLRRRCLTLVHRLVMAAHHCPARKQARPQLRRPRRHTVERLVQQQTISSAASTLARRPSPAAPRAASANRRTSSASRA